MKLKMNFIILRTKTAPSTNSDLKNKSSASKYASIQMRLFIVNKFTHMKQVGSFVKDALGDLRHLFLQVGAHTQERLLQQEGPGNVNLVERQEAEEMGPVQQR